MILTFHPAKNRPKVAGVLCFALGILLQALWQFMAGPIAVALWMALVLSLRDFFLPTEYRFESEGLTIAGPLRIAKTLPWKRFRSFVKDRNGLFLTPYRQKRFGENHRGVFLPLSPELCQQAIPLVVAQGIGERS